MDNAKEVEYLSKQELLFNLKNRGKEAKDGVLVKSFTKDATAFSTQQALSLFAEDGVSNTSLLAPKNFEPFSNETAVDTFDDSYENLKYNNYVHYANYRNLVLSNFNTIRPLSYVQVMDAFRPDFEEKTVHADAPASNGEAPYGGDLSGLDLQTSGDVRFSNPFKLRASTKNAIVTYNAIQKVFKSRFDEGRSNARLQDFSNSFVSHPFLTAKRSSYEALLGKNKDNFFTANNYKHYLTNNFSDMYAL
jgi:hypothetical protein